MNYSRDRVRLCSHHSTALFFLVSTALGPFQPLLKVVSDSFSNLELAVLMMEFLAASILSLIFCHTRRCFASFCAG